MIDFSKIDNTVKLVGNKIYGPVDVRIDAFTLLTGEVQIGHAVHIASHCLLMGSGGKIIIEDYVGISSGVKIYTATDDYTGPYLSGPLNPDWSRQITKRDVFIGKGSVIGAGSIILPGAIIGRGCAIGSLSLVKPGEYREFCLFAGVPATFRETRGSNQWEKLLEKRDLDDLVF